MKIANITSSGSVVSGSVQAENTKKLNKRGQINATNNNKKARTTSMQLKLIADTINYTQAYERASYNETKEH